MTDLTWFSWFRSWVASPSSWLASYPFLCFCLFCFDSQVLQAMEDVFESLLVLLQVTQTRLWRCRVCWSAKTIKDTSPLLATEDERHNPCTTLAWALHQVERWNHVRLATSLTVPGFWAINMATLRQVCDLGWSYSLMNYNPLRCWSGRWAAPSSSTQFFLRIIAISFLVDGSSLAVQLPKWSGALWKSAADYQDNDVFCYKTVRWWPADGSCNTCWNRL